MRILTIIYFYSESCRCIEHKPFYSHRYFRLKNEIEQLQAEHAEDVVQLQQKYKLEIDLLKDQLLESDARNESLEQEVRDCCQTINTL